MHTSHNTAQQESLAYYDGPEVVEPILQALRDAGLDTSNIQIDDLAALDEFHALGRVATVALAELCGIEPGASLLDVGAGIGGPSRVLAERYRAHVTSVEQSARFCRANTSLCKACGLTESVEVVEADATGLPFADGSFDVAWTQALIQNVQDKHALFSELRRVIRPDGRLAIFEVLSGPGGELHLPVPWADEAPTSFLVSGEELRELVTDAGFEVLRWNQGADALADIQRVAEAQPQPGPDRGLGLHLLMPGHDERMASVARNIAEQRITLLQAILRPR